MRDAVLVHDLSASELQVGSVNFPTKDFVERRSACEDDGLAFHLHSTLSQADEVSADTDGARGNEGDCEDVIVSAGSLASNETGSLQALHAKTFLQSDDV